VAAKVVVHDNEAHELDIEAALNFAEYVMTNAAALYNQLSVEQKRRLLSFLSADGSVKDMEHGFRTVTTDCVFNGLYALTSEVGKAGVTDGI
jgi:hypothetical protein